MKKLIFLYLILSLFSLSFAENIKTAFLYSQKKYENETSKNLIKLGVDTVNNEKHKNEIEVLYFNVDEINDKDKLYKKLIDEDKIKIFITYNFQDETLNFISEYNEIPIINFSSKNSLKNSIYGRYKYNLNYSKDTIAELIADFSIEKLQNYNAIIIKNSSDSDSYISSKFKEKFEFLGGTVLKEFTYDLSQRDFNNYYDEISSLKPDLIFMPYSIKIRTVISGAEAYGLNLNFITDKINKTTIYTKSNSVYGFSEFYTDKSNANYLSLLNKYESLYDSSFDSELTSLYDSIFLLSYALENSISYETEDIKKSLDNIRNLKLISGDIIEFKNSFIIKDGSFLKIDNRETILSSKQSLIRENLENRNSDFETYRGIHFGDSYIDLKNIYSDQLIENSFSVYSVKNPSENISLIYFYLNENKLFKIRTDYYGILENYKKIVIKKFKEKYGDNYILIDKEKYQWRYKNYKVILSFSEDEKAIAEFYDLNIN